MIAIRENLSSLVPHRGKQDSHPGLLLQRYLQESATGDDGDPEQKRSIFEAAINAAKNIEVRKLYEAAFVRWKQSLPELTAADELQTVGRLIVGLGTENVLETGIRLHHTYGLPILPGSALKGLAAHYCHSVWGETKEGFKREGIYQKLLFGDTDESGCIIFHDGWFVPDSESEPLKLDVMTPHHPDYNRDPEKDNKFRAPTDFDSPTPVPFLSVAGRFHVAVSWCGPVSDKALSWRDIARNCLRDALFHWGIGGKTSSGYGLFNEEQWKSEEVKRQAEAERSRIAAEKVANLAARSPIERSIQEFLEQTKADTSPESSKLATALKQNRWTDRDLKVAIAQRVKEMLIKEGKWKDKGKEGERKKLIQDILENK